MAVYLRPGVFVQETLNVVPPIAGNNAESIAAFIGTADRGPTTPTLVNSFSQFINLFGSYSSTPSRRDLHYAMLLFFSNGGSQAYVSRVAAANAATAVRSFNDRANSPSPTLQLNTSSVGAWGNNVNVTVSNSFSGIAVDVTVYYGGVTDAQIVEKYTDLNMTVGDDRYLPSIINSQSKYLVATDLGSSAQRTNRLPVAATNAYLAGASDGSSVPTASDIANAVSVFDTVRNSLILNAPGVTDATAVNLLLTYADTRKDVFLLVDPVSGDANTQINTANSYSASSFGAVYYPKITISDPTTTTPGLTVTTNPGGAIAGIFVQTDAARGVFKAPAGLSARIGGAVAVASLSNSDLDALNSNNAAVNAIKFVPGSGIVVMGSRTLLPTYVSKYVPVRRSLIYLEKSLSEMTQYAIFEPNDAILWRSLEATVSGFLSNFWRQGGLRGDVPAAAFYVKCDAENNPLASINNGIVNIEVGVALQRPAEFVVIKIGQFDGGTTVTSA